MTKYRFHTQSEGQWKILEIGHFSTEQSWSKFRRIKWKARLHLSVQFDMDFGKVLRYDMLFDFFWMAMFIYLQILAVLLSRKAQEENEQNQNDNMNYQ